MDAGGSLNVSLVGQDQDLRHSLMLKRNPLSIERKHTKSRRRVSAIE